MWLPTKTAGPPSDAALRLTACRRTPRAARRFDVSPHPCPRVSTGRADQGPAACQRTFSARSQYAMCTRPLAATATVVFFVPLACGVTAAEMIVLVLDPDQEVSGEG